MRASPFVSPMKIDLLIKKSAELKFHLNISIGQLEITADDGPSANSETNSQFLSARAPLSARIDRE